MHVWCAKSAAYLSFAKINLCAVTKCISTRIHAESQGSWGDHYVLSSASHQNFRPRAINYSAWDCFPNIDFPKYSKIKVQPLFLSVMTAVNLRRDALHIKESSNCQSDIWDISSVFRVLDVCVITTLCNSRGGSHDVFSFPLLCCCLAVRKDPTVCYAVCHKSSYSVSVVRSVSLIS